MWIFVFLLLLVSSFSPLLREKILCMIPIFLNLFRLLLWPNLWPRENVQSVLEKNAQSVVRRTVLYMSIVFSWIIELFKSSISLLIFWLNILSVTESVILKSPAILVELSISPLQSVNFYYMVQKDTCTPMFIAALFTVAKT